MGYDAPSKKYMKENMIGQPFTPEETSMFGNEYKGDGDYVIVGPDAYRNRKWFAEVTVVEGKIAKVI